MSQEQDLLAALEGLDDETLQRLSRLPIEKVYNEVVEKRIVPNRLTRRANARRARRRKSGRG